jgi:hypothetical protein
VADEGEAFDRGHAAGAIAERLASHDRHFSAINGSLDRLANEMHTLTLAVQRLGDQAVSRDATVVTTAAALKDAEEARRQSSEHSWSPWARAFAAVAALATAVGLVLALMPR